ncbi:MAG TPA: sigma-70 family RNA polymerase sigma factor [Polyangiaceae bacterium]|nr:sigma-70 family RNA polymerase sigma factor [Polyangiaceae bacterium]
MRSSRAELEMVQRRSAQEHAGTASLDPDYLFRSHARYVAAIAHRLLGRDQDVDDTVQEVFLIAVRGHSSIRDAQAVRGWLARVTVRVARRRLRARRIRGFFGLDEASAYDRIADGAASPEQRALLTQVYAVLDRVPCDARVAWVLRHVEGERLEDVARLCGCSLATAKRRIAQAERLLDEAFTHD